jgi:hypothetical protein
MALLDCIGGPQPARDEAALARETYRAIEFHRAARRPRAVGTCCDSVTCDTDPLDLAA